MKGESLLYETHSKYDFVENQLFPNKISLSLLSPFEILLMLKNSKQYFTPKKRTGKNFLQK